MRIVEPWIKVEKFDGKEIMRRIERACRTCYRSEDKITDESYKNLLKNYNNEEYLIIGDSLKSDVGFAMNCKFDSCWFNKNNEKLDEPYKPTIVIQKLEELKNIL